MTLYFPEIKNTFTNTSTFYIYSYNVDIHSKLPNRYDEALVRQVYAFVWESEQKSLQLHKKALCLAPVQSLYITPQERTVISVYALTFGLVAVQ